MAVFDYQRFIEECDASIRSWKCSISFADFADTQRDEGSDEVAAFARANLPPCRTYGIKVLHY